MFTSIPSLSCFLITLFLGVCVVSCVLFTIVCVFFLGELFGVSLVLPSFVYWFVRVLASLCVCLLVC